MAAAAFAAALAAASSAGSSNWNPGTAVASRATSVIVESVLSSAEIWSARAGSLPAMVPGPVCLIRGSVLTALGATVTCVVLLIVVSADLIRALAASSAGVKTSLKLPSPLIALLTLSKVPAAASVTVRTPGRTSPMAFTSTLATVLAAIFTVPPFTAPLAPTAIVELLVCLGVTLLSCDVRVEVSVTALLTSVVRTASPVPASTVPARVIPASPLAVTLMVEVSAGAVSAIAMSLRTATLTPVPRMTAPSLTVTAICAVALPERSSPDVVRTGVTVASAAMVTWPLADSVLPAATLRVLAPSPPLKTMPRSPASALRLADTAMLSSPAPPSKVTARFPDAASRLVSKTILSAPAPPLIVKEGAGGRLARWSVSLPLPRITPRLVVGAVKARLPKGAAAEGALLRASV